MEQVFVFQKLPENLAEMMTLPEAGLTNPFMTAALTVASLCRYEQDPNASIEMLNALRGPRPLSNYDLQFLKERLAGKGTSHFHSFPAPRRVMTTLQISPILFESLTILILTQTKVMQGF